MGAHERASHAANTHFLRAIFLHRIHSRHPHVSQRFVLLLPFGASSSTTGSGTYSSSATAFSTLTHEQHQQPPMTTMTTTARMLDISVSIFIRRHRRQTHDFIPFDCVCACLFLSPNFIYMNFNVFIYVTLLAFSAQGTTTPKRKIENDEVKKKWEK